MTLQSDFSAKITKVKTALENVFVKKTDITTSFSSTTSDSKVASEKLVKDSLDAKASSHHPHSISDVTSLQTSLNDKIEASDLLDLIYPVGSIYMSVNSTSPATLFGGTWQKIEGRFLLASGTTSGEEPTIDNTYTLGDTGGSATVTLTAAQSGVPAHNHGMAHTHNHNHSAIGYTNTGGSGTARRNPIGYNATGSVGTLATDADNTASSKSQTDNNAGADASEAHDNMPPYIIVNVWERTA